MYSRLMHRSRIPVAAVAALFGHSKDPVGDDGASIACGGGVGVMRIRNSIRLLLCFLPATAVACDRTATIYVSRPQVFTRERLVMSRQKEVQFLNAQLDKDVSTGFQGAIDTRLLTAFQNSLTAALSPTPATTTRPTDSGVLDLSKQVAAAPTTQSTAANATLSTVDHFMDQLAYRDTVNAVLREKELDDTHDLQGRTLYTLKFDSAILPGGGIDEPAVVLLQLGGDQLTDDQWASLYAKWVELLSDHIQAEELELVDRLQRPAMDPDAALTVERYLAPGVAAFRGTVPQLAAADPNFDLAGFNRWLNQAQEETANYLLASPEERLAIARDASAKGRATFYKVLTGIVLSVDAKYRDAFKGLIEVSYTKPLTVGSAFATLSDVTSTNDTAKFRSLLGDVGPANKADFQKFLADNLYADSIDPQNYSQNISDVSSKNELLNLSAAISAIVGHAANVGDAAQYLQQSQALVQAIKRNPVAVGFTGGRTFGWMLGSPFGIGPDRNASFTHVPARQSFAVSIVAPLTLGSVKLSVRSYWLDGYGRMRWSIPTRERKMIVALPNDPMAVLTYTLNKKFNSRGRPQLREEHVAWTLQSGLDGAQDQTLLILGDELWRNPSVFVDSQQADSVDTLPDMRGLVAHFKHKLAPVVAPDHLATLTVVTSVQPAQSIPQSVTVLPPPKSAAPAQPTAALARRYAVGGSTDDPLSFAIDPKTLPASFADFTLSVRPGGVAESTTVDTLGAHLSADKKTLSFAVPTAVKGVAGPAPALLAVDFRMRLNPFDDPLDLLAKTDVADRTIVFFPIAGQNKLALNGHVLVDYAAAHPTLQFPLGASANVTRSDLYRAYPGLQASIANKTARAVLSPQPGKAPVLLPISEDPGPPANAFIVDMPSPKPVDLADGTYPVIDVQFSSGPGSTALLPVIPANGTCNVEVQH